MKVTLEKFPTVYRAYLWDVDGEVLEIVEGSNKAQVLSIVNRLKAGYVAKGRRQAAA